MSHSTDHLTDEQRRVTQDAGTEAPFSGEFWDETRAGRYDCIVCGEALFSAESKFDAGCGWPSYNQPLQDEAIEERRDSSHGMLRTEVRCAKCSAHLGHVFPDGPAPTGQRYCINSASLSFEPKA